MTHLDKKNPGPAPAALDTPEGSPRKVEFDYLRTFAVLLVLFHHAILAYTTNAFFNIDNPIRSSNPVVDEQRWLGFDLLVAFNETYFMPLLFFVSGIFVCRSLARKGARKYLTDRLQRLGIPFVTGVVFLVPLAYYPSQLQAAKLTGADCSYLIFWLGMIRSGFGTAGPLWFLWLLLAFNCLVLLLYRADPLFADCIRERAVFIFRSPVLFFGATIGITIPAYLALAITFGPLNWIGFGPFHVQAGRLLLYLVYFLAGTAIGTVGLARSAFLADGELAKRWWLWMVAGLVSFSFFVIMVAVVFPHERTIISEIAFVFCCGAFVFGVTGFFLRFVKRRGRFFDSLSDNAYGIYIVHWVFVTWIQYILLASALSPWFKGMIVFLTTLVCSWAAVSIMRRIPGVARVI